MRGKYLYVAVAALLGALSSIRTFLPLFFIFIAYFSILIYLRKLSRQQSILLAAVFLLSMSSAHYYVIKSKTKIPSTESVFYLQFTENPTIDGNLFQIFAKDRRYNENLLIRYKIKTEAEKKQLEQADVYRYICLTQGEMKEPSVARNENAFDYKEYLNRKQIYRVLETNQSPFQTCLKSKPGLIGRLKEIRYNGIRYLEEHFPAKLAAISAALIYGDRNGMEAEVLLAYQQTGIIHLLAISGLHVSLFISALYFLGIRAGATKEMMTSSIMAMLPGYAVLTGGTPSVVRSVLMIFLVMASMKWKKTIKLAPMDSISIAFILYLLAAPMALYDAGFQLSFVVSAAIILSAPIILKRNRTVFSKMVSTSVVAQLAAYPILLFHFFEASFISIAANLLFVPLYSFVFLPGVYLLSLVMVMVGSIPDFLLNFSVAVLDASDWLVKEIAVPSAFRFTPGRPSFFSLILYAIVIPVVFIFWEKPPSKRNRSILLSAGLFLLSFQIVLNKMDPSGEVTMIDVGQGDSILIHLPDNKGNYLIDTGGTMVFGEQEWQRRTKGFEVGRDVVVPYLKGRGITRIDKLILTHGDQDHIGGAKAVITGMNVKEIVIPSVQEISENEVDIFQEAARRKIPIVKAADGDHWKNANNEFFVLSPPAGFNGERNRGSLTLWADIGGLRWFFGGDLDQTGEEAIISRYPNLKVDVLKAGHHGSNTSSSPLFLQKIMPKISLISVGEKNRFGHPNSQVIKRLEEINSGIYRTDRQGAITYRFYGKHGTFSAYLP